MDALVLLLAAIILPALGWWLIKICLKMLLGLVKMAAFGGLALGAAYLTFTQAEFPAAPSEEAKQIAGFLQHRLSEKMSSLEMPKLKVDFEWPEHAQAEESAQPINNDDFRHF